MKIFYTFIFSFCFLWCNATTYYVDSSTGSDSNAGTTPQKAWKSINRINEKIFHPGDSILFAANGVWLSPLQPQGSGTTGKPIVISSYGNGNLPLFAGKGFTGKGVISLFNQSYWEISNLELTNDAPIYGDRRGIEIKAANAGVIHHIHLKNLLIHHIKGLPGNGDAAKKTAGIYITVTDDTGRFTRFDDILIDGCIIYDVANEGIALNHEKFEKSGYPGDDTWSMRKFTNVTIRNNVIYRITKNAMIIRMTEGGIVEHNLCFQTATHLTGNTIFSRNAKGTLFQYNEGFLNMSHDHDGSLYDPDLCSPETIWQYSYSHDNAHGLLWICTTQKDNNIIVKNNISENDRGFLIYYNYAFKNIDVYRNIFLTGSHVTPYLIRENPRKLHLSISFRDNYIYNKSRHLSFEYQPEENTLSSVNRDNRKIRNNMYQGKTLSGKYENESINLFHFMPFHRGFHHSADILDTLFHTPYITANPIINSQLDTDNNSTIIATVNGIPVYDYELGYEMEQLRYRIYTEHLSQIELKEKAIQQIVYQKVQEAYLIEKKMPEGGLLQKVRALMQAENDLRKANKDKSQMMFFGPTSYSFNNYWEFLKANTFQQLKIKMENEELILSEKELKEHFHIGDQSRIDAAWEKRGYEYSLPAIRESLLNKKYQKFFEEKAAKTRILFTNKKDGATSIL